MRYEEAQTYLNSLGNEVVTMKFGLDGITRLLATFDNPQMKVPSILVAGTNGKGSTCAMLSRILRQAGLQVGLFTSPHLLTIEERIQINGRLIAPEVFAGLILEIRSHIDELLASGGLQGRPTFFEHVTAAAFLHFARSRPDIVVLEVGMGGRLDATNIVTPLVSVITNISHDHQQYLGQTLTEIAGEKAAIIKPGGHVLTPQTQAPEALAVIRARVEAAQAHLGIVPPLPVVGRGETGRLIVQIDEKRATLPWPNSVQAQNAALAVAAARLLLGNRVEEAVPVGLNQAQWPGRTEWINTLPPVLLDGAHNPASVQSLTDCLRHEIPNRPITMIFTCMRDKPVRELLSFFVPYVSKVVLVGIPGNPRALTPPELFRTAAQLWFGDKLSAADDFAAGYAAAKALTPENGLILVAGSLYLVGEAHRHFNQFNEGGA